MVDSISSSAEKTSTCRVTGITLDTGALIALVDQKHLSMQQVVTLARKNNVPIHIPAVIIAEWWRSGRREKERLALLRSMEVIDTNLLLAKIAGDALTTVRGATTIDAIVMATTAHCGDIVVYTSDIEDLERLRDGVPAFANIRVEHA